MKARELMTSPPVVIPADATVEQAAAKMKDANVGALPVHWGAGTLCGVITDRDIALNVVAAGKGAATQVGEACTLAAVTVEPDADIEQVVYLMKKHQVRRLPVVEGDDIQGMISLADIVLAQERLGGEVLARVSQPTAPVGAGPSRGPGQ